MLKYSVCENNFNEDSRRHWTLLLYYADHG